MKTAYSLSIVIVVVLGCATDFLERSPDRLEKLEVLWRSPITNDVMAGSISMNPLLHGEFVVVNSEHDIEGHPSPVMFLDTATGEVVHYWSDHSTSHRIFTSRAAVNEGNFLLLGGQQSVDCINLQTRSTQWQSTVEPNSPYLFVNDAFVYRGIETDGSNPYNNEAVLMRAPVSTGNWERIYSFTKTDNLTPSFTGITCSTLNNGDNIVAWKNRSYVPGNGRKNRTDIFSYNLTTDSLMWRNMDFDEGSDISPMKIDNDTLYGLNFYSAFAIDLLTGETIWETDFKGVPTYLPLVFFEADFFLDTELMILKGSSREVFGVNKHTGKIEWIVQGNAYGVVDEFSYFENKLFFGTNVLDIIDAHTGKSLLDPRRANEIDVITSRITIDPIRRVMYFTTYDEILCVKIPDDL